MSLFTYKSFFVNVSSTCLSSYLMIFQNIIQNDMPRLSVFDLLRETDAEFIARTNWQYTSQAPIYVPDVSITVQGSAIGAP